MISIPGRIPIHIHPLFWGLILLIGWLSSESLQGTAIWALVIFVSVLVHEYGHAFAALACGQKAEINLIGLGGMTSREGPPISLLQEFIIVLCGPLAGFALYFLAAQGEVIFAKTPYHSVHYAFAAAARVNLFWTILNLLPIMPLDGGNLLRIVLEKLFGLRGVKIALLLSVILGAIFGLLCFFIQAIFAGSIFFLLAFESFQTWSQIKNLKSHDADIALQQLLRDAQKDLEEGRNDEAMAKLIEVKDQTQEGVLFILATELIARLYAQEGQMKEAYEMLLPYYTKISPEYLRLLQQIAYRLQEWETAIKVGDRAYQKSPTIETAVLNAIVYAILGKPKPSVGWLRCAIESGFSQLHEVTNSREFDAIRRSQEFQELISKK